MALIRQNEEYVRAIWDKYEINNGQLSIPVVFYKSKSHRDFEKINIDKISIFKNNVDNYVNYLESNIHNSLKIICPNVTNPADYQQFSEVIEEDITLKEQRQQLRLFIEDYEKIKDVLKGEKQLLLSEIHNIEIFKSLGLDDAWLASPVIIERRAIINIGTIGNLQPSGQVIYGLLKEKIPNTTDDL